MKILCASAILLNFSLVVGAYYAMRDGVDLVVGKHEVLQIHQSVESVHVPQIVEGEVEREEGGEEAGEA